MLVLSAMPHHHHGSLSCFNPSHCVPEEKHTGCDQCNHDHPVPSSETDCLMNFLGEATFARQSLDDQAGSPEFTPLYLILVLSLNGIDPVEASLQETFAPPYKERFHACLLVPVHAGRAPPRG
jgi:hypothetical protein